MIAVVELLARGGLIPNDAIPPPLDVARELGTEIQKSVFWSQVARTMEAWAIGLGLAVCTAIPIGLITGGSERVYMSVRVIVDVLRPIPAIALLPLALLVIGINLKLEIFTIALAAFWPLFFQTVYGMQDIDAVALDTARVYRLGRTLRFVFVSLPGATPYIATGMRLAATIALLGAVGTELVIGLPGLGSTVVKANLGGNIDLMYAYIAAIGFLGLVISSCFAVIEKRLLKWHASQRRDVAL